uniref:Uncharacterized protein n=1 Tax=Pseudo-nitzschia australis TaxID=44445 RepID=A0A7S4AQ18_9STRA|mmetsp:Transcript_4068/g.7307  ORF Transcript_4068/g.7307 Transcript_4068/m.7307 type:complete len:163 (+) Transcript_4068:104-592(+)
MIYKNGARITFFRSAIALVIAIALARDTVFGHRQIGGFHPVAAFQQTPIRTVPRGRSSIIESSDSEDAKTLMSSLPFARPSNTILFMAQGSNKNKNKKNSDDGDTKVSKTFWKDITKKPGNIIMFPFVAIFGIDLVLNIFFVTKRAIEYFVFGKIPSSEPWW